MESLLMTTTGRVPACSLPSVGSRRALKTSPRAGFGSASFGGRFMDSFVYAGHFPVTFLEFPGHRNGLALIVRIVGHLVESRVNLRLGKVMEFLFYSLHHELVKT